MLRFDWLYALLTPRVAGFAAAAIVAIIALQAITIGTLVTNQPTDFRTASAPQSATAGPSALVTFVPMASVEDITALLESAGVQIIEGPKPGGIYKIAISAEAGAEERLTALEDNELVQFFALSD